jgi:D-glycero-D-manno-heptose 1,7-bisphosphate phosphatase
MPTPRPGVFLDRDGTIIEDPGYLKDPSQVRLIPGAAEALVRLEAAGYRRIVITNQSGIGRGLYDRDAFDAVQREVERQLAEHGASVDATYHCPHLPDAGCPCRKPGTAIHREAAARFGLDLARSWCVGDRPADFMAATELGAGGMLVRTGEGERHATTAAGLGIPVAADLAAATRRILG